MTTLHPGNAALRALPGVDRLLQLGDLPAAADEYSHGAVVDTARDVLAEARASALNGGETPAPDALADLVLARLRRTYGATLVPVINATGVVVHTNLGRAPLSPAARAAMLAVAQGYSTLEFDVESGGRGSRHVHAAELLRRLTGAEDALVVNNCASAVLLALTALAAGREVVVSRGQAVEIGGAFRIPDVMRRSGAELVEVGTTNRTYGRDYADAITERTALLLRVHSSNFKVVGFTHEVPLAELAEIARTRGVGVLDDLGSGALLDTARFGLAHEPTVQESVAAGADLVAFSGDKLLGGPQAGVLVGRRETVDRLRRHPLARAIRIDKLSLAALQATLLHYLRGDAVREVPVWRMLATPAAELERRAAVWRDALADLPLPVAVSNGESTVGGGSLPGETLPTRLLDVDLSAVSREAGAVAAALRRRAPAVVARVDRGHLLLDPRTVLPDQDAEVASALRAVLA